MRNFLLYTGKSHITGKRLGKYLGVECGKRDDMDDDVRYDHLIRWGASDGVHYIPSEGTINKKRAINKNTNKYKSLKYMSEAGVPTPNVSRDWRDLNFPMLARKDNHMEGRDISLLLQSRDAKMCDADYYVEYVPKKTEYRCHVMNGQVIKVSEKKWDGDIEDYNPYCWNYEKGWVFGSPRSKQSSIYQAIPAVKSLGLDFGAVDMIVSDKLNPYILEVNTSPGLCKNSLELYGSKLANLIGKEDYPGMGAVEFPDDEDSDEEVDRGSF